MFGLKTMQGGPDIVTNTITQEVAGELRGLNFQYQSFTIPAGQVQFIPLQLPTNNAIAFSNVPGMGINPGNNTRINIPALNPSGSVCYITFNGNVFANAAFDGVDHDIIFLGINGVQQNMRIYMQPSIFAPLLGQHVASFSSTICVRVNSTNGWVSSRISNNSPVNVNVQGGIDSLHSVVIATPQ